MLKERHSVTPQRDRMLSFDILHSTFNIHLMRRSLDRAEAQVIPGAQNAGGPFFSPDGRWVGFATGGRLMKVPVDGGPPVAVCDTPGSPLGSRGESGVIVFSIATTKAIYTMPASGGDPVVLATRDAANGELVHEVPEMLPGGRELFYSTAATSCRSRSPPAAPSRPGSRSRSSARRGSTSASVPCMT